MKHIFLNLKRFDISRRRAASIACADEGLGRGDRFRHAGRAEGV